MLALAGLLSACATKSPVPPGTACETTTKAMFYKYGPAQTFGADQSLAEGTRVTLVSREFGYSRVALSNGVTGYVSSDELRPLPPEPKPKDKPPRVASRSRGKLPRLFSAPVKRSDVESVPGDPLFDITDVPGAMNDSPSSKPVEGDLPKR
jgi:hypothetical protein